MTDVESKLSAAFLAALMITSVAAIALIAGPGAATNNPSTTPRTEWFPNDETVQGNDYSHGNITLDAGSYFTVFQGEEDIENWKGTATFGDTLTGDASAGAEGEDLDLVDTIPRTQQVGDYSDGSSSAHVSRPRVNTLELYNSEGIKVSGAVQEDQVLLVKASWNYLNAEDLTLEVTDETGTEVQRVALTDNAALLTPEQNNTLNAPYTQASGEPNNELLDNEDQGLGSLANLTSGDRAFWALRLNALDAGDYTVTVEGVDDLTFGEASKSRSIEVTAEDDAELELDQDSATQGQKVKYTIEQSDAGLNHVVAIETDDIRDRFAGTTASQQVFEFAGDTELRSINQSQGFTYAIVEIDQDSGVGVGRIDTQYLDDTSVDVKLYDQNASQSVNFINDTINGLNQPAFGFDFQNDVDESTLDVQEGEIVITNPGATYVPEQEIDLNGTAPEGMDEVAIYTRDEGDWELLLDANVDSNGKFEEEDVVLTREGTLGLSGNQTNTTGPSLLNIPDIYRFGAIDAVDADFDGGANGQPDGLADANLTSRQFNSGASNQRSLRVALPTLTGQFETYAGAVWNEDDLTVTGRSIGPDRLVALFTGEKGDIIADDFGVDTDDTFDQDWQLGGETVSVPTGTENHRIREGRVLGVILSQGRDAEFGDGRFEGAPAAFQPATIDNFVDLANSRHQSGRTLSQLIEIFRDQTIEDEGSDDLIVSRSFRLTGDSGTQVQDLVPATQPNASGINPVEVGETTIVRGITNLKPDDNTIVVEVSNGTDANKIPVNTTESWGFDGRWNVTLDVPTDVTPGNYSLQADDPDSTDTVSFQIVAQGQRPEIGEGDVQQLQNQIQELEGQVQQLRQRNQQLNSTVSDLRAENQDLQSQLDQMEGNATGGNETGDTGGQPGFTPVVAVIALISAALIALRRR